MTRDFDKYDTGSAVVPNTLVCEVSRLFAPDAGLPPPSSRLRPGTLKARRLLDLFALVDAVCLHEKLYTLPANLGVDVNSLALRQRLIAAGVLETLDIDDTHADISRIIVESLRSLAGTTGGTRFAPPAPFSREQFEEFFSVDSPARSHHQRPLRNPERQGILDASSDIYQLGGGRSSDALWASSYAELAQSLIWSMHYQSSGAYEDCVSILRDMYYIYTSEAISLPYWPQLDRIEFSRKFPTFMDNPTRVRLYALLAQGLRESVDDVEADFRRDTVFIPPFAAVALSRSGSPEELLENILAVRQEYSSLRQEIGKLESERRQASSLRERRAIMKKHKQLFAEAAKAFDRPAVVSLESVIRYVPELAKPATSPTDPTKFGASLLLQPIEWLTTWWRRRPISKLLQLSDQVHDIQEYSGLLENVFGAPFLEDVQTELTRSERR